MLPLTSRKVAMHKCIKKGPAKAVRATSNRFSPSDVLFSKLWFASPFRLERSPILKPTRDQRNASAKALSRIRITEARPVFISVALSHRTYPTAESVQVAARTTAPVVSRQVADAYPNHSLNRDL